MSSEQGRSRVTLRNPSELGEVLRHRREELGLTLDEASDRFGVSKRLLLGLEHGTRGVSVQTVLRLVQSMGLDIVLQARSPEVELRKSELG